MAKFRKKSSLPMSVGDRVFDLVNGLLLALFGLICAYPVWYVLINTFSDPARLQRELAIIIPHGLSFDNFIYIFRQEYLLRSYLNAFLYTAGVVIYSTGLTILGAYVLSRKRLIGRNMFMFLIWFTMVFSGGLIPTYLVVNDLHLVHTVWAVILPCAISQYNLIVGAGDVRILLNVILPVSLPTVATIALFYGVGQWNSYFKEMIYLNHRETYPLQLILRELLVTFTDNSTDAMKMSAAEQSHFAPLGFKSAVIFMSVVPMVIIYPFIQRFFIKGIMIGAIKG